MSEGKVSALEGEVEIKSGGEKYFGILSNELHHLPNASSDKIKHIEVHEGCWKTSGSVKLWKFVIDGVSEEFKERVEIDEEKKTVSMIGLEGHAMELYKTYKIILQVGDREEGGLVKLSVEYENRDDSVPPPTKYFDYIVHLIKDLDQHVHDP